MLASGKTSASKLTSSEPLLRVEDLSKYFHVSRSVEELFSGRSRVIRAVDEVSFGIEEGETLGLVGESGCGKTTTAKMILGLYPPSSGHVYFRGVELYAKASKSAGRALRREIQAVMQDPGASLDPRMRVGSIIEEPLVIHRAGNSTSERRNAVFDALKAVGLPPSSFDSYPHELSGGQQQRVAIARALTLKPSLVVLDEPVSALDMSVRAQILNLLKDLQKKFRLTYLFVAHDLSVVRYMCDEVAVMYLGRIVEQCKARELFVNPMHPYTKALLDAVPVPDPSTHKNHVPLVGSIPSPLAIPSGCRFRSRCPRVMDVCTKEEPELRDYSNRMHYVSCHLYENKNDKRCQALRPAAA